MQAALPGDEADATIGYLTGLLSKVLTATPDRAPEIGATFYDVCARVGHPVDPASCKSNSSIALCHIKVFECPVIHNAPSAEFARFHFLDCALWTYLSLCKGACNGRGGTDHDLLEESSLF